MGPFLKPYVLALALEILLAEKPMDLLGSTPNFTNSPTLTTPIGAPQWIVASVTINELLPAALPKASAPMTRVLRSYCHVHRTISARMFRCLRFVPFVTAGYARLAM